MVPSASNSGNSFSVIEIKSNVFRRSVISFVTFGSKSNLASISADSFSSRNIEEFTLSKFLKTRSENF
jgi:hypothetical protein